MSINSIKKVKCLKCNHEWYPRFENHRPIRCTMCGCRKWDTYIPRRNKNIESLELPQQQDTLQQEDNILPTQTNEIVVEEQKPKTKWVEI